MIPSPSIEIQGPAISEIPVPSQPPSPSLHQLPAPPADYTGKPRELDDLLDRVRFDGNGTVGIFGMGGIGKTAFALKLAQDLIPRYPDAQIFFDLKGTSAQPLSAVDAMMHVIRSFDPIAPLGTVAAEVEGKYRSVLSERRVMIFLDDVASKEQILPVLPPEGCLLIMTSRSSFALPGLIEKHVEQLPAELAREFILRIAPRLEQRAAEMAKLCGGLPLALRAAASMLVEHRDLSVDDCMRRLSQIHERRSLVEDSIAPGYALLSPELQRLWRLLSVFPDKFDAADAGTIWGMNAAAAQDFLSVLLSSSMLQWSDPAPGYSMHVLHRLWADGRSSDEERRKGQRNLSEHGVKMLSRCNELYLQGGENIARGLALFESARPNIEAGWAWASMHAEQEELADQMCARYPVVGHDVLDIRYTARERFQWLQAPLAAARRMKDKYAEGILLCDTARAYFNMGETQRAVEYNMLALTLARETGDRKTEEHSLGGLGLTSTRSGELPHAREYLEKSLALARELGDRRGESECLGGLGELWDALDNLPRAIDSLEQALSIARETGDRRAECRHMLTQASVFLGSAEQSRALDIGAQALVLARELGDRRLETSAFEILGRSHSSLGNLRRAIESHESELRIARELGDPYAEGDALGSLGKALTRSGDVRRALEFYQDLLKLVRELGDRRGEATVLGNIGKARARLGETRVAIGCHSEQLQIAREIGDRHTEGNALWNTSLALEKLGDRAQAITHAEAARRIFEDTGNAESARVVRQLDEWTEREKRSA